jgi:hypothetical protein
MTTLRLRFRSVPSIPHLNGIEEFNLHAGEVMFRMFRWATRRNVTKTLAAVLFSAAIPLAAGNVVTDWNTIALQPSSGTEGSQQAAPRSGSPIRASLFMMR